MFRDGWISSGWAVLSRQLWGEQGCSPECRSVQIPTPAASRGVLSKGCVGKKSAKSEVLLHHSAPYFMQNHYICWTTQAKMWRSRDRAWVLALETIGTVYFLLTMFSLFSSKAFPVTPSVSIILSSEEKKNFMRLHLYICLLIITQVR